MIVYWIELTNERLGAGQYDVKNREWSSLTKMMEMIPLGMVAVDRSGNIIAFNQPLIRAFEMCFPICRPRMLSADRCLTYWMA